MGAGSSAHTIKSTALFFSQTVTTSFTVCQVHVTTTDYVSAPQLNKNLSHSGNAPENNYFPFCFKSSL